MLNKPQRTEESGPAGPGSSLTNPPSAGFIYASRNSSLPRVTRNYDTRLSRQCIAKDTNGCSTR